jgi:hypothetical protein
MMDFKSETPLWLPNQGRVRGGKNLDGSIWLELTPARGAQVPVRVGIPPDKAVELAIGILKVCGYEMQQIHDEVSA